MTVRLLQSAETRFLNNDNTITASEMGELLETAADFGTVSTAERATLAQILQRNADRMEPEARANLEAFLANAPAAPPEARAVAGVVSQRLGNNPSQLSDDALFFARDGKVESEAGINPFTRSFDSIKNGVLRTAHGSRAPESTVLSAGELTELRAQKPGASLDRAAKLFGLDSPQFEAMSTKPDFYDPNAKAWWGKCHAWSWSAMDNWVNSKVDVEGPAGRRGLWLGGQWLSRADLGNWMMAVADKISLNSANVLFDNDVTASDLLKGMRQFMMEGGGGVVSDIHNDKKKGTEEVWNQPFKAGSMESKALTGPAADSILAQAKKDGITNGTTVRLVKAVGTYGVEVGDGHEDTPGFSRKNWNIYVVTNNSGQMLTAYEADNAKMKALGGLPTTYSDDLPEYFWKPRMDALADVLAGRPNQVVDNDVNGDEFRFFVNKLLKLGVPGTSRTQFEEKVKSLGDGAIPAATAAQLKSEFPGIANAYSPQQWEKAFGSRGLTSRAFGAAWTA